MVHSSSTTIMAVYTTDHAPSVLQTHSWRTIANSAAYLLPYLRPNMKVLDLGCGPGSITVDLAKHVPQGHVTGVEYVSDPLDGARALAKSRGVDNVNFVVGDIHKLDFPDDSFDLVHVHQVLQHITNPVQALREMRRVAKSNGGIVAARESAAFTWYPDNERLSRGHELSQSIAKARGGNPTPGRLIHVWAEQAGFKQEQIRKTAGTWCFSTPEERKYWGGGFAERMRSSGYAEIAVSGGYATKEQLEDIAQGYEDWVKEEQGWFAVMHGEIVCLK